MIPREGEEGELSGRSSLVSVDHLTDLLTYVAGLDSELNSHRLARYEVAIAFDYVKEYLTAGRREDHERVSAHLLRCVGVLALNEHDILRPLVGLFLESVEVLSPSEREAALSELTHGHGESPQQVLLGPSARRVSRALQISPLQAASDVALIVRLLHSIPRGLQRWVWQVAPSGEISTRSWDIVNESDVQGVLWLALAPTFADLRYEESLPSVGRRRPRADFVLPEQGIVVEAKFVRRSGTGFSKVVEEVSADVGLYLGGSRQCEYLVVFVWDNSRSSELHEELLRGLRSVGVTDAVVVGRPGFMSDACTSI